MEVKALQDTFINILRYELNETKLDRDAKAELTPEVISALFSLSKRHDLTHIVSSFLYNNDLLVDEETKLKYSREEIISVYRYEQIRYAYDKICGIFDEADIPYIPLKGSVIRPYYPRESMRTSCDIDILIKEDHLNVAVEALTDKGFICGEKNYHDVSLYSPNKIHLELHFNIQENIDTLDVVLKDAWNYAMPKSGCCYEFTKEFFLFYIFAHMSYHFLSGGCGIRSLMDIWVIEHKMGITYYQAEGLLEAAGIYAFAKEISTLVDACFSNKPKDEFHEALLSYIFNGGVYGSVENNIAINNSKPYVTPRYIINRIFVPYKDIIIEYPFVKRVPLFYIFCLLHRTVKLFFRFVKRIFKWKGIAKNISVSQVEKSIDIRGRLGL